jgi:hypothetical protein
MNAALFARLRELHVPAPFRRAQSVVSLAQIMSRSGGRHKSLPSMRARKTVMGWVALLQRFAVLRDIEAFQLLLTETRNGGRTRLPASAVRMVTPPDHTSVAAIP